MSVGGCTSKRQMVSHTIYNMKDGEIVKEKSVYVPKGKICIVHDVDVSEDSNGEILRSMLLSFSDLEKNNDTVVVKNGILASRLLSRLKRLMGKHVNEIQMVTWPMADIKNRDSLLSVISEKYQSDMVFMLSDLKISMQIGNKKVTDETSLNNPITSYSGFEVDNVSRTYTFPKGEQDISMDANVALYWYIYDSREHITIALKQIMEGIYKELYSNGVDYKEIDDFTAEFVTDAVKVFVGRLRMN